MIKKQAQNTRVVMSVMMEGSRGTGRRGPDPASKAGGGDPFLDADFIFCIFIFKKFWHLQYCGPIQGNV